MHEVPERRSPHIAVIGAGPAGMTAAETLQRLGYRHVTVFEALDRVGGKVYSLRSDAGVVELGAVLAAAEYQLVLELADFYQIPYAPYPVSLVIMDEHGQRQTIESFLSSRYTAIEIKQAISNYAAALERFAEEQNTSTKAPLCLPFSQFAEQQGFSPIAELARSLLAGFGYSYNDTTPAFYFMKLIGLLLKPGGPKGLQPGEFFIFPSGYQSIWEAMARNLDVRLESVVTSVTRRAPQAGSTIQITINGTQHHDFDAVIISAPLHIVGSFLNLTEQESALFAQVRSDRYFVNLFRASGLGTSEFLFFHQHARPEQLNHINAWANRDPEVPLYIGWQLAERQLSLGQVSATLEQDVVAQGGEFLGLALRQEWDYFPRVDAKALLNGFYEQVEELQGVDNVFYVGSSLSFETVEHSARHAQDLVRQRFPALTS